MKEVYRSGETNGGGGEWITASWTCSTRDSETGRFVSKSPVAYIEEDRGHDTPCWIWQRGVSDRGYGGLEIGGKRFMAHRYYFEQRHGPIAPGMVLDHLCRNSRCVNPDHLEAVTQAQNVQRGRGPKLNEKAILSIRLQAANGAPFVEIARGHGVDPSRISRIVNGKSWKGVGNV